jgi:two-component system, NtrC family, response regulator
MNVVGADSRVSADWISEVASSAMLALYLEPLDRRMEATGLTYAPDALLALGIHTWPGNVRELQNRVRRAVIMAQGKRVTLRDLELTGALSALLPQTLKEAREVLEREMVQDALRRQRGKSPSSALELGISRPTMHELMEKLGIAKDS